MLKNKLVSKRPDKLLSFFSRKPDKIYNVSLKILFNLSPVHEFSFFKPLLNESLIRNRKMGNERKRKMKKVKLFGDKKII